MGILGTGQSNWTPISQTNSDRYPASPATMAALSGMYLDKLWASLKYTTTPAEKSYQLGLYASAGTPPNHYPATLIAASEIRVITLTIDFLWYEFDVPSKPILSANTIYWLVAASNGASLAVVQNGDPSTGDRQKRITNVSQTIPLVSPYPAYSAFSARTMMIYGVYESSIVQEQVDINSNGSIFVIDSINIPIDAWIFATEQVDIDSDSSIKVIDQVDINSDSNIRVIEQTNIDSDSNIQKNEQVDIDSDSSIKVIDQVDISVDSCIIFKEQVDINSDSNIRVIEQTNIDSDSNIQKNEQVIRFSNGLIVPLYPPTLYAQIVSDAYVIEKTVTERISSDAYIVNNISPAVRVQSRLRETAPTPFWDKRTGIEIF